MIEVEMVVYNDNSYPTVWIDSQKSITIASYFNLRKIPILNANKMSVKPYFEENKEKEVSVKVARH